VTPAQLKNLGLYVTAALVGAVVATGLHFAQILSGTDAITLRPLAATFTTSFFGALATALGTSFLTRIGSETIASQVNDLKAQGVPKARMIVLSDDEAATALETPDPKTLAMADRIYDRIAAKMFETSADASPPSPDVNVNPDVRFP